MESMLELKRKLNDIEQKIDEVKKRLPAHSVKPPIMMALISLEDEYESVLKEIEKLKNSIDNDTKDET